MSSAANDHGFDAAVYARREQDWRNGAIVYQVLVDRFVPSAQLEAKRGLYPAPKVLRDWAEPARPGVHLHEAGLNSQELDFWGGDLASLSTRLDYVQQLGADALYLNPIHLATPTTNTTRSIFRQSRRSSVTAPTLSALPPTCMRAA